MPTVTLYDKATGEVKCVVDIVPDDVFSGYVANLDSGTGYVLGAYPLDKYYIDPTAQTPKQKTPQGISVSKNSIAADGVDTCVLSGVAVGSELRINGADFGVVSDGVVEFTTNIKGPHRILLRHPKHKDFVVVVTAI